MTGDRMARATRRLAQHLAEGRPLGASMCATCTDVLTVAGAGISLLGSSGLSQTWSSSGPLMARLEELEQTLGEGPCIDAATLGVPVAEVDLAVPVGDRWVAFARAALGTGARAAFGYPLAVGGVPIGALNLYDDRPGALTDDQHEDALVLAEMAAHVVLAGDAEGAGAGITDDLADIGVHQVRVHQAMGMVAAQLGPVTPVPVADALAVLRARAFATGRPLGEVAADVIARRIRFGDDLP